MFFFGESIRVDQSRVFLLIGMGGCGKTQLARKFMETVYLRFNSSLTLVFYIDATTTETLQAGFASIARTNGFDNSHDAALAWMSTLDQPFFLYIDNADDHTMNLRNYFPKSNYARILITTRLRDAKQKYGTGRDSAIHLDPLGGGEAKELLLLTADLEVAVGQEESVCELLQELHCHPLAVVQAGAAIFKIQWTAHTGGWSVGEKASDIPPAFVRNLHT